MELVIFLYIITGIIVVYKEYKNVIKLHKITMGTLCFLFYAILCCIVPGLTIWKGDVSRCKDYSTYYAFISYLATLLTLIASYWGYSKSQRGAKKTIAPEKTSIEVVKGDKNLLFASVFFLVVSFVSLLYWSSGYGGIVNVMLVGDQIRSSFLSSTNSLMFLKHLIPLSIISSLILFTDIFVNKDKRHRFFKMLVMTASIIVSFIYIMANDGRMLAGTFLLYFIMIILKYQYEVKGNSVQKIATYSVVIIATIFFVIIQSEAWFAEIRHANVAESEHDVLGIVLREFNFIYISLNTALYTVNNGMSDYVILNDLLNGLFAWLPTALKPVALADVWDYNTLLINDGGYGQSPACLAAQSFYDLGLIGLLVVPFTYTYIVGKVENLLDNDYSTSGLVFYVTLGFYFAKGMAYFSFYNIMMNIFFVVVGLIAYKKLIVKI